MHKIADPAVREALDTLAELLPAAALIDYAAELRRAKDQSRNGSYSLEAIVSFGTAKDAWITPRYRPRRKPE